MAGTSPPSNLSLLRAVEATVQPLHQHMPRYVFLHRDTGHGGGGDLQDPSTKDLGKPRNPELSHPTAGLLDTNPPTQPPMPRPQDFARGACAGVCLVFGRRDGVGGGGA